MFLPVIFIENLDIKKIAIGLTFYAVFIGIPLFGFFAIAIHLKCFYGIEKNREITLFKEWMEIRINSKMIEKIARKDITNIILYDKLKLDGYNLFPTLIDNYYYLVLIVDNEKQVVNTCLMDIHLKKKIANWSGKELEHKYRFFPLRAPTKSPDYAYPINIKLKVDL